MYFLLTAKPSNTVPKFFKPSSLNSQTVVSFVGNLYRYLNILLILGSKLKNIFCRWSKQVRGTRLLKVWTSLKRKTKKNLS